MVKPIGPQNEAAPNGYTKIKLYDEKTKKTETFFVPVGKKISVNGKTYDPSVGKNNEFVFTGTDKKDTGLNLIGLALEHMDVNKDGRIDQKDTDYNMSQKLNKKLDDNKSEYYIKANDAFSDAGISKGTGGVVFSKDGQQSYSVDIE